MLTRKGSDALKGKKHLVLLFSAMALALAASAGAGETYTVRSGDSLWDISKRTGVPIHIIKARNNVSANKPLQIGQVLVISQASTKHNSSTNVTSVSSSVGHIGVNSAALRSGASTSEKKLRMLERGTTLQVVAKSGDWSKVTLQDGTMGWVYSSLIKPGKGTVAAKPAGGSVVNNSSSRSALVRSALANRGARYRYGGTSRGGFDCSGFVRYVYAKYGVKLPHSSRSQYSCGKRVSKSELEEGDLVFFQTSRRGISHVGIYIGDGRFVHASNRSRGVCVDALSSAYYSSRYVGACRVK